MQKVGVNLEIDQVLDKLIKSELITYCCQIFKKDEAKFLPFGSSVLSILGGNYFLLTASHVIEYLSKGHLFFRTKNGYATITGMVHETDIIKSQGIDIAFVKLDTEVIKLMLGGYRFLPISKFMGHNNLFDAGQYCVIGFPESNIKIDGGKLMTGASAYFVKPSSEKTYDYYGIKKEIQYAMEFKGKGTDLETGKIKKNKASHYGLSGCGLWIVFIWQEKGQYFADFRLIGIMTEFRKGKYHCLIGNKIVLMLKGIKRLEGLQYIEKPVKYQSD